MSEQQPIVMQRAGLAGLLAAAGAGTRMGGPTAKQFLELQGISLLGRSCLLLQRVERVEAIIIMCPPGACEEVEQKYIAPLNLQKPVYLVDGGHTRQHSVRNGLKFAAELGYDWVVIHDAARPFATVELFDRVIEQAFIHGAACAAWPSSDTVKIRENSKISTVARENVWLAQTPQAFRRDWLEEALGGAEDTASDEAQLIERMGRPIELVAAPRGNFKITTAEDWQMAQQLMEMPRIGQGYDVHALKKGRPLILAGVEIDFHLGLEGHSDADVLTHALMDALLSAAAMGDIGRHFPDSEARWKGASSLEMLKQVRKMLADYAIVQVSAVLMAQAPKIAPYIQTMRANWAAMLELPVNMINIAATTTEGLGFVGRGEGMAAQAVATITARRQG